VLEIPQRVAAATRANPGLPDEPRSGSHLLHIMGHLQRPWAIRADGGSMSRRAGRLRVRAQSVHSLRRQDGGGGAEWGHPTEHGVSMRHLYTTVLLGRAGAATVFCEIQAHGTSLPGMELPQMLLGGNGGL
jgi:hypothetical protein